MSALGDALSAALLAARPEPGKAEQVARQIVAAYMVGYRAGLEDAQVRHVPQVPR